MNNEIEQKMIDADLPENDKQQVRFLQAWGLFRRRFESGHIYRGGDVYDAFEAGVAHGRQYASTPPTCPKCGEAATYQTPDGTFYDSNAHYWRLGQ